MDKDIAEDLIEEFDNHVKILDVDKYLFLDVLTSVDVSRSKEFYAVDSGIRQTFNQTRAYHYVSLLAVLNNGNVSNHKLSLWERLYGVRTLRHVDYSLGHLINKLRSNSALVTRMKECGKPFTLLGQLEFNYYDNSEEDLITWKMPVLGIPGADDSKVVNDWEKANKIYLEESGIIKYQKRISEERYNSLCA